VHTALDVLAVMYLQNKGFRYIETLVVLLILTIGGCFLAEMIFSKPSSPASRKDLFRQRNFHES